MGGDKSHPFMRQLEAALKSSFNNLALLLIWIVQSSRGSNNNIICFYNTVLKLILVGATQQGAGQDLCLNKLKGADVQTVFTFGEGPIKPAASVYYHQW